MPLAVAMFDNEIRYLQASPVWCIDYGLGQAQLRGKSLYELSREIPSRAKKRLRRNLAGEATGPEEILFQRADGRRTWRRWEIRPWGGTAGHPAGLLIFSQDLPKPIPGDENTAIEARYQGLVDHNNLDHNNLDHTNEGVARCKVIFEEGVPVDFIYLEVNRRFEELTGLRDAAGKAASELVPGIRQKDPELFEACGRIAQTGSPGKFEIYVNSLANWFSLSVFPAREGDFRAIFEVVTERRRVEMALREHERELQVEVSAAAVLTGIASKLWRISDLETGLDLILPAAIDVMHADMGNLQIWDEGRAELKIAAHRGFSHEFLDAFSKVDAGDGTACARALHDGQRVMITDIETDEKIAPHRAALRAAGVRAVQSTPLVGRGGKLIGVLSTHFRTIHLPGEADWRRLDPYVQLASGFIQRCWMEEELRASRREFLDLADNSPDGIARLDPDGCCTFLNRRLSELSGCRPGDSINQLIGSAAGDSEAWARIVRHLAESRTPATIECVLPALLAADGISLVARFVPETDPSGNMRSILMIATEVTELRQASKIAHERGSIIEALFESAAQGIIAVDADGKIRLINRMAEQMFGYEPGELINQAHDVLVPDHLRGKHAGHRKAFLAAPKRRLMGLGLDLLARRKDGSLFPVEVSLNHLTGGQGVLAVSFVTDITIRRQQNEELGMLRARILAAEEEVARGLARELHDDVTQRLAFLSMKLGRAAAGLTPRDKMARTLREFQTEIRKLSDSVRGISHRMHPAVLDDLGLSAALEELCVVTQDAGSATVHFEARGVPSRVDRTAASCLYRVCQQCMSNILRHARAEKVEVLLEVEPDALQLTIIDNGVGFEPDLVKKGLGTYSMTERVGLLNGEISIESGTGRGTRVRVRIPVKAGDPGAAAS